MIVKICGIKRAEELEFVERYADFTGVVMDRQSKRFVDVERAREIVEVSSIPVFAVVTSMSFDEACRIADRLNAGHIQIHSENFPVEDFLRLKDLDFTLAKAFRIPKKAENHLDEAKALIERIRAYNPDFCILDTGKGSGEVHDIRVSREVARKEGIILAGGLNPENVRSVIEFVKPAGVDVSSGVERNGRKNENLVKNFVRVVKGDKGKSG